MDKWPTVCMCVWPSFIVRKRLSVFPYGVFVIVCVCSKPAPANVEDRTTTAQ